MSFTTTFAPSRAASSAISRPMPRPAPVTTMTLPSTIPAKVISSGSVATTKLTRMNADTARINADLQRRAFSQRSTGTQVRALVTHARMRPVSIASAPIRVVGARSASEVR
jgi:hypothetical protein